MPWGSHMAGESAIHLGVRRTKDPGRRVGDELARKPWGKAGRTLELFDLLGRERHVDSAKVVDELVESACPEDGMHSAGASHGPGDRDL